MPYAFSYVRFSSPEQASGDSLRRQSDAAAAYCKRKGLTLDEKFTYRDLGVSAYRGSNALTGNLGLFLQAIKSGAVPAGSTLIVESFDRLSRQGVDEGMDLVKSILKSGVRIVTLKPEREFDRESLKRLAGTLEIQLILDRAMEESEMKSKRCGEAWRRKKQNAINKPVTKITPRWIELKDGKLQLIPDKVAIVRRAFALARQGLGINRIAQKLNEEKRAVLGTPEYRGKLACWGPAVVHRLLTSRSAFGEYQPCSGGGKGIKRTPDGDVVKSYYPPAVGEDEFNIVRGIMTTRGNKGRGRRGKHVNLFSGLLKEARTGGTVTCTHVGKRSNLIPVHTRATRGIPWWSFSLRVFEESLRAALAEVRVEDFEGADGAAVTVTDLANEIAGVDALMQKWRVKMDDADIVETVAAKLGELAARRKKLVVELHSAEADAAHPASTLRVTSASLKDDDARERYRAAVRRVVDSVWILVMSNPKGQSRYAAVQVWFKSGESREFIIGYRCGAAGRAGAPHPLRTLTDTGIKTYDLRDPDGAEAMFTDWLRRFQNRDERSVRRERVRKLHGEGKTLRAIAAVVDAHSTTVLQDLIHLGLWKRQRTTEGQLRARREKAVALFEQKKTIRQIADKLGVYHTTVLIDLRAMGSGPTKRKSPTPRPNAKKSA